MPKKHNLTGRSTRALSPFIAIERYVLKSPAWHSLSLAARASYLVLLDIYNGTNNGLIALSAKGLAKKLPIGRSRASQALTELEEKGFIDALRNGGFNMKSGARRATEWRLNCYRCDVTGQVPSKNFMRWQGGKSYFAVHSQSLCGPVPEHQN